MDKLLVPDLQALESMDVVTTYNDSMYVVTIEGEDFEPPVMEELLVENATANGILTGETELILSAEAKTPECEVNLVLSSEEPEAEYEDERAKEILEKLQSLQWQNLGE